MFGCRIAPGQRDAMRQPPGNVLAPGHVVCEIRRVVEPRQLLVPVDTQQLGQCVGARIVQTGHAGEDFGNVVVGNHRAVGGTVLQAVHDGARTVEVGDLLPCGEFMAGSSSVKYAGVCENADQGFFATTWVLQQFVRGGGHAQEQLQVRPRGYQEGASE